MSLCGEIWRKEYIDYTLDNHILFSQACKAHILKMDFLVGEAYNQCTCQKSG